MGNVDKRDALMKDLNKEIDLDIEAWKQIRKQQILNNLNNKRKVLNEILCSSTKNLLTRTPSRINLMEQIRTNFNEKSATTTLLVENWRQNERNNISNNLSNKNIILGEILSIKSNGSNLRHAKDSQLIIHKNLLQNIRSASIPEWKEKFFAIKIKAIQNKHNVCIAVQNGQFKLNCNISPVDQKIKICAQIRLKFQNLIEEWKQVKYNSYAKAIGQKYLTNLSVKSFQKVDLKTIKSLAQNKIDLMKQVRTAGDNSFPIWKEQEFDTKSNLIGVKILLNEEIKNVNVKTLLKSTQGQKNQRIALLKEIRSCEPLEYWKENELNEIYDRFNSKRLMNEEILSCKMKLKCQKS